MENTPLYNSRIAKNYLEYVKEHYPAVDIDSLLEYAEMTLSQVEDGGHWFTQRQVDRFQEILINKTGNPNIARESGRNITLSKAASIVSQYAVGFITPGSAYKMLSILTNRFTRATFMSINRLKPNKIKVITSPKPGTVERFYQCQNRLGAFESIGKLFTGKYANVKHPECIHEGGKHCEYIISWHQSPSFIWKKIRNYVAAAVLALLLLVLVLIPQAHPVIPVMNHSDEILIVLGSFDLLVHDAHPCNFCCMMASLTVFDQQRVVHCVVGATSRAVLSC